MIQLQGKEIKTVEQGRNALAIINKEWAKQAALYGANSKEADALASKIAQANLSLPAPVTDVKDIIDQVANYNKVVDGADT